MKKIYMVINGKEIFLEKAPNMEAAQLRVDRYKREDRYEVEVEGYHNPMPEYVIR